MGSLCETLMIKYAELLDEVEGQVQRSLAGVFLISLIYKMETMLLSSFERASGSKLLSMGFSLLHSTIALETRLKYARQMNA